MEVYLAGLDDRRSADEVRRAIVLDDIGQKTAVEAEQVWPARIVAVCERRDELPPTPPP
jgi:hypothetical protein